MAVVQKRIAQVSLAKQSAKGSGASAGTYQVGVEGGQIIDSMVSDEIIDQTWSSRDVEAFDRLEAVPASGFDLVAMPNTLGMLLYGACGADTVTGAGDPYTHTFKTGTDLPYWTLFATYGAEFFKLVDAKVDSLELTWDRVGAMRAKVAYKGCTLTYPGVAYTAGTDERPGGAGNLFKGAGGIFTVNSVSSVVKSGSIKIENKLQPIVGSASAEPVDVVPGEHTLTLSLVVVPADTTLFRAVMTGATNGAATVATILDYPAEVKFKTSNSNHDLDVNVNSSKVAVAFPNADPQGGAAEVTVEMIAKVKSDGTAPYSIALRNAVASY